MSHPAPGDPDPCPDHGGEGPTVYDLPVPRELREEWRRLETRRQFLGRTGKVLGWAGLSALLGERLLAGLAEPAGAPANFRRAPHFAPTAKRCIYLFMSGGPPQMDLWDYKPGLADRFDQDIPASVRGAQVLTSMTAAQSRLPVAPSPWKFQQQGKCGRWVSELLPWTGKVVDELAIIHSLNTDAINHEPATLQMNTGNMVVGKPSMGSWLGYGLGSMNENLPTFVVLNSRLVPGAGNFPITPRLWGSGFLPSQFAGVALRSQGEPVLYLNDPAGLTRDARRELVESVNRLNAITYAETADPETQARISQYEMAFHMQTAVPELTNLQDEPAATWDLYGAEAKEPGTFAYNCLLSRRMAERGVRFTQIYQRGWDMHTNAVPNTPKMCAATDRGCYALITDLKRRGLLDSTLVVWGGEFGRTVYSQGGLTRENFGRDHHPRCFTSWMAGGGVKPGISHGATDDYCYNIVRDPVHVRDFNATLLHLLGIDHEHLTFKFQGLDQKLTGVEHANVVEGLLG
ncbi:MAG: hypothetical protein JWM88_2135 [Verrucomicrobia bacterium]|nr:hypothetical protein [Verrucomicrobiota bacterium]